MRLKKGKMEAKVMKAYGGPWDGLFFLIPVNGTMVFKLGGWKGSYGGHGTWIPLK